MIDSGVFTFNRGKDGPYKVTLPKIPRLYNHKILFQQWVLWQNVNSKVLSSKGPFAVEMDGKFYEATLTGGKKHIYFPLTTILVWKKRPGTEIRCDGTEKYQLPTELVKRLENEGKIYFDLTNEMYAVDDRRVYE